MRVSAPAKVNLYLGVGAVRADGYHDVTTILHALELADEVVLEPSDRLELEAPGLDIPASHNLAYRAASHLAEALGKLPRVRITLIKRIPHQAGLGGGSSDAAAVLFGLARQWGVDPRGDLCRGVAAALGADIPFFLSGPCALMTGRGDSMERALTPLEGLPVALVRPDVPVPTAAAYAAFDAEPVAPADPSVLLAAIGSGSRTAVALALSNNLQPASSTVAPQVGEAVGWARSQAGCLGAQVAGSGSAVFALTGSATDAERIAEEARGLGWWGVSTALGVSGVSMLDETGFE